MKVEIISIGDELLIGQTINTNASWMGTELSLRGAEVNYCTVIKDDRADILDAFERAMSRVDVVLVTGGLGPTKDDITKRVLCEFFNTELVLNEAVLAHVKAFFDERKRTMLDVNIFQAHVPQKATALHNKVGTAPGMLFEENGKMLVSMPGVPYEMKGIFMDEVLPRLAKKYDLNGLYYQTIQTQGIGESYIADRIQEMETEMRATGIYLAYLPSPGGVRMRLSSENTIELKLRIDHYIKRITELIPQYVFGHGDIRLQEVIGTLLTPQGLKLGTIESCTGGGVGAAITSVPGSSVYYEGSIVSYSYEAKKNLVGVHAATLEKFGAVSREVVEEMAVYGKERLEVDYCISLSGIAGPDGGMPDKPVGTVWIAIAGPNRVISKVFQFEKDRQRNIQRSVLTALNLLRCELLQINIEKS